MSDLVPTSSAIFGRPRPDLVPIMNRPGRGHGKPAGHSLADLVPDLVTTSSRSDEPSRDEVVPHLTSRNARPATSSHLVRDEVGTTSSDLVPRPPPFRGTRTSVAHPTHHTPHRSHPVPTPPQTCTAAMKLTLHRLTNTQPGAVYEEITRLCAGGGIEPLAAMTIHLADCMAAVLIKDTGSRNAAIEAIQKQLAEAGERS